MNIFDFDSYKKLLRAIIAANQGQRAFQKTLAAAAGCQASYLSQVLNGKVHLTPDQAHSMAQFLKFTKLEVDFFIGLVSIERAASSSYRDFLEKRLSEIRKSHSRLTDKITRASAPEALGAFASTYYSGWYYIAVHMLCTLPLVKTEDDIAKRLSLKRGVISAVLSELKENGLVQYIDGEWRSTNKNIHLPDDHPMISRHHANWRFHAANQIPPVGENEVQYTALYSLARSDIKKIKSLLNEVIIQARNTARKSPEEELVNLNIDFLVV